MNACQIRGNTGRTAAAAAVREMTQQTWCVTTMTSCGRSARALRFSYGGGVTVWRFFKKKILKNTNSLAISSRIEVTRRRHPHVTRATNAFEITRCITRIFEYNFFHFEENHAGARHNYSSVLKMNRVNILVWFLARLWC